MAKPLAVQATGVGQVVSGLVKHIPLDEMQGRSVVLVANLKPGNMRGIKSQAMVLAASNPDGTKVSFQATSQTHKCCTECVSVQLSANGCHGFIELQ